MRVSVCITTCNRKLFIRACINSALAQTFKDFELIICDDASTDGTWEIIQSFSDPRIRAHRSERNIGMVANWNWAVSLARGTYLKPLHDDDLLDPHCLEAQVAALDKRPDAVVVTSGRKLLDAEGKEIGVLRFFSREVVLGKEGLTADMLIHGNLIGEPSAVMVRREALVKAGLFSNNLPVAVDMEMWLRLTNQGKIVYLPGFYSSVRRHIQMATKRNCEEGFAANDVFTIQKSLLENCDATWCARRIAWGRAAGSIVHQALIGIGGGRFRWPAKALRLAFRLDPGFLGFMAAMILFRSGVLGLRWDGRSRIKVGWGSTLDGSAERDGETSTELAEPSRP